MPAFSWLVDQSYYGLSPMDGYTDSAFRQVVKEVSGDDCLVTFTEFTSADGLYHARERLKQKLAFQLLERPIIAQIFGKDEKTFIEAAHLCEEMGFDGIDINMGCPSKKVVRSEHGVALRKNHPLAFRLIKALVNNTALPVSVKTRLGWSDASDLIEFGLGVQDAGAQMICIHGRTYVQPYKVEANWDPVYKLKRALSIRVLGNGGILSWSDGLAKQQCLDGFLIGQASIGNPWVFCSDGRPSLSQQVKVMKRHARLLIALKGEIVGIREIRKHLLAYIRSFPGAKVVRSDLARVSSLQEIDTILDPYLL